jgi:tetratricopeptide (TPR) repeat protein
MHRAPTSPDAWEFHQRGLWYATRFDRAAHAEARCLFERAIALDPTFAAAHIGLSRHYALAGVQHLTMPMDEALRLSTAHAAKATELDPGDADAHARLAGSLAYQGDLDSAEALSYKAIGINPSCALAHEVLAGVLICAHRMTEARRITAEFERLSPRDANIAHAHGRIAISYYLEGAYRECVETARRQLSAYPGYTQTWRWLGAALAQLGQIKEARIALNCAIKASPREFDVFVRNRGPWMCRKDHAHMIDGLRKVGIPQARVN